MALKFLNKKGWHTGSLRNIENVWKAEQKHEAEQRKLEELRKQIQEERERADFLRLQESAGYVPRQERLDFLYESGLGVGKGSSEGFKALQAPPKAETPAAAASEPSSSKAAVPGALFEDKPQSANDAWRKLHSDPLLLIRQREQEAIAHIKNNPIQMAMIKKSVEAERQQKEGDKKEKKKKEHKKHHQSKLKHDKHLTEYSDSEDTDKDKEERSDRSRPKHHHLRRDHKEDGRKSGDSASERQQKEGDKKEKKKEHKKHHQSKLKHDKHLTEYSDSEDIDKDKEERSDRSRPKHHHLRRDHKEDGRKSGDSASEHHFSSLVNTEERRGHLSSENRRAGFDRKRERTERFASEPHHPASEHGSKSRNRENWAFDGRQESGYTHHRRAPRLSEEERAARVREMQHDAELHEEQRWKRIKKSSEADAREAFKDKSSSGRNFLDAAQKSMFGTEKGGSSTIEESVRRRTYYSQGGVAAQEINAFRRQ